MTISTQEKEMNARAIDPGMIEAYFDGELKADELGTLSRNEIMADPIYESLDELRRVVRTDSKLALNDIDGMSLLDAINGEIDAYEKTKKSSPSAVVAPTPVVPKQTVRHRALRWVPAIVAAALFILSIPGWVSMLSSSPDPQMQQPTVVYVGANHAQQGVSVCPAERNNYEEMPRIDEAEMPLPPARTSTPVKEQLTVEEMDYAIRHLIKRIESLEEANRLGIESGQIPFDSNEDQDHSPNL